MPPVLDCSSEESTYQTIEGIYGIERALVEGVFENNPINQRTASYLELVEAEAGKPIASVNHDICWFHLTRRLPGNNLQSGILPLAQAIEKVWEMLGSLVPDADMDSLRRRMVNLQENEPAEFKKCANEYSRRIDGVVDKGPFAILIREVGVKPSNTSSDFLAMPEIVYFIWTCFEMAFPDKDLHSAYKTETEPCVVSFVDPDPDMSIQKKRGRLGSMLAYLYVKYSGDDDWGLASNCNYDGKGTIISRGKIRSIRKPNDYEPAQKKY